MARYGITHCSFINPYNFVPVNLENTKRGNAMERSEELLTGYFQCCIRCRTPLAIPDVEHKTELNNEHDRYPFFTVNNKYIIPGSAIRGVILNVFETITNCCFWSAQGNPAVTARSSKAFAPGLLKKEQDGWKLYQATKYLIVVDQRFYDAHHLLKQNGIICVPNLADSYKTGDQVNFEPAVDRNKREIRYEKYRNGRNIPIGTYVKELQKGSSDHTTEVGYICIGEKSPRRHFQGVFKQDRLVNVNITEEDMRRLEDVREEYQDERKNRLYPGVHKGYPNYVAAKNNGVIPVYYSVQDRKLYMTFAALGRKAYSRRWNDIVLEKSHEKCDKRSRLCPACALFGTAQGDKFASRIRFTDAEYTGDIKSLNRREVTFAELGLPRPSYIPFYLRETKANADYSIGYDSDMMEIRGRKFYWHHVPDMDRRVPRNKRNATFETVGGSAEFKFRIYFDGITEQQMQLLAMAVHLNENDADGHMCHKIGHGKPLGYGSVKIYIKECKVRAYDLDAGWREKEREVPCDVTCYTCGKQTLRALNTICDFDVFKNLTERIKVEYPEILLDEQFENRRGALNDNVLASHRWFTQNYKLGNKMPQKKLPEILDEDLALQKYMATDIDERRDIRRNNRNGGGRR